MMSPLPANLRINADDFGINPSISRAIAQGVQAGWVNSISVTPFSDPESGKIFAALAKNSRLKIGAHLTFLEVPLLTRPKNFPNGIPPANHKQFLLQWFSGRIHSESVYGEWKAQIQRLQSQLPATQRISHLDSHQHIHLLPGLWTTVQRLQSEFAIPFLRVPWEGTFPALGKDPPLGLALQVLARWRKATSATRANKGEKFFGVGTSMGFRAETYRRIAAEIVAQPNQPFELMIHPDETPRGQIEMEELRKWLGFLESVIQTRPR